MTQLQLLDEYANRPTGGGRASTIELEEYARRQTANEVDCYPTGLFAGLPITIAPPTRGQSSRLKKLRLLFSHKYILVQSNYSYSKPTTVFTTQLTGALKHSSYFSQRCDSFLGYGERSASSASTRHFVALCVRSGN